jgi:hypothetical protein
MPCSISSPATGSLRTSARVAGDIQLTADDHCAHVEVVDAAAESLRIRCPG